jgi:hypothetical protein
MNCIGRRPPSNYRPSWQRRPQQACTFLAFLLFFAPLKASPLVELQLDAPPECPSKDSIEQTLARLVKRPPTAPLQVSARLASDAQRWVLVATLEGGQRVVGGDTCVAAAEALVVIMALAIDPANQVNPSALQDFEQANVGSAQPTRPPTAPTALAAPMLPSPCSLLGSWDTLSEPWNGMSTASVITFDVNGTFSGIPTYAGQYTFDGTNLVIWNESGSDMACTYDAQWAVQFDSTCASATLVPRFDNCTGARRYLDWNVKLVHHATGNVSPALLSEGDSNAVSTGGYWWTFTDHNGQKSPYHAAISPMTSLVVALQPVVDSDPAHGNVLRVSGSVPPALPWSDVTTQQPYTIDQYWPTTYPDSTIWAYPGAGIGFGFKRFFAREERTR